MTTSRCSFNGAGRVAIVLLAVASFAPARAHHSFAMFDGAREVQLDGTVREYQWTNPHIFIQLDVKQGARMVEYSIEGGAVGAMSRKGWNRNSFKAGDKVRVSVNPARDGSPAGSFVKAEFADGHVLAGRF